MRKQFSNADCYRNADQKVSPSDCDLLVNQDHFESEPQQDNQTKAIECLLQKIFSKLEKDTHRPEQREKREQLLSQLEGLGVSFRRYEHHTQIYSVEICDELLPCFLALIAENDKIMKNEQ